MQNEKELIQQYLRDNHLDKSSPQNTIKLIKTVAEIPWGKGRTIEEVLVTKMVGTCTGKHLVLLACLEELKEDVRSVVCTFRWRDQGIKYPEELKKILEQGEWEHGHNFVQIRNNEGTWIDVDVTWNSSLKTYGFRTLPEGWNGQSSFIGVDNIQKRWEGVNVNDLKSKLINSLSTEIKERRELFLQKFIEWIKTINK